MNRKQEGPYMGTIGRETQDMGIQADSRGIDAILFLEYSSFILFLEKGVR